jgi:hypothetical protein
MPVVIDAANRYGGQRPVTGSVPVKFTVIVAADAPSVTDTVPLKGTLPGGSGPSAREIVTVLPDAVAVTRGWLLDTE